MARVGAIKIARAFANGGAAKVKSTATDGTTVWLHGNAIAWKRNGTIEFSLCGWNTVTTRDRLKHIFDELDIPLHVCQIKHNPYVCNYRTQKQEEISSRLTYAVTDFI